MSRLSTLCLALFMFPSTCFAFDYTTTARWRGSGQMLPSGPDHAVAVSGNIAVAGGPNFFEALGIYDVANPAAPITLSSITLEGGPTAVQMRGAFVYVAGGHQFECCTMDFLYVIDLQNLGSPVLRGSHVDAMRGFYRDLELVGDFAYLVDSSRLAAIDIADPAQPTLAGSANLPSEGHGISALPPYLYIAGDAGGLLTYDITNPHSPSLVHTLATPDSAFDTVIDEDKLYVALGPSGVAVVDLNDPAAPQLVATVDVPGTARKITLDGDLLCVGSDKGTDPLFDADIHFVDVSNPLNPVLRGNIGLGHGGLVGANGHLFVAGFNSGLQIYDPSLAMSPETFSLPASETRGVDLRVVGSVAYVAVVDPAGGPDKLVTFDVSDPTKPLALGSLLIGGIRHIDVQGNYAYVASSASGLHVVDISNPASPVQIGSNEELFDGSDLAVSGGIALWVHNYRVRVIDISDPTNPIVVATILYNPADRVDAVAVSGSTGYIARRGGSQTSSRLIIVDLSDPANPTNFSSTLFTGREGGLTVDGDRCYYTNMSAGLPSTSAGLRILDVSDPSSPIVLSQMPAPPCGDPVVSEGIAYLPSGTTGLVVVDVSDPTAPNILGEVNAPGQAWAGAIAGEYVLAGDYDRVLTAVPIHSVVVSTPEGDVPATKSPAVEAWPNPANGSSSIRWSLPVVGEKLFVSLWDVSGRRVREFLVQNPAVSASLLWDGTGNDGQPVSSGVYFIRLTSGASRAEGRLTIVR